MKKGRGKKLKKKKQRRERNIKRRVHSVVNQFNHQRFGNLVENLMTLVAAADSRRFHSSATTEERRRTLNTEH